MYNTIHHGNIKLANYTFLVTGGAGFIGSNLVEYLLKHGAAKVRVLDDFSTGSRKNIAAFINNPAFELIEGDIREYAVCEKAVNKIDFISHQAALGSVPRSINDPITTNEVNITGFLNMLVAAKNANVRRMIYAASSSTYGDSATLPKTEEHIGNPLSPYAVTKYVNELYADVFSRINKFNTIGLRYFNVFGPKQNPKGPYAAVVPIFIESALKNIPPFINGDGETSRDFTFVENAVQANIKGLFADIEKSEVINIAFGERTSLNSLWNKICLITHSNLQPIYRDERLGDVKHSLANIEKAKKLIGYQPEFSVLEGLSQTVNWYKNNSNH
jgi:UDP-N-acetylglucosamine 4-epimerase